MHLDWKHPGFVKSLLPGFTFWMSIEKTVLQILQHVNFQQSSEMCFNIQATLYHKDTNIHGYE